MLNNADLSKQAFLLAEDIPVSIKLLSGKSVIEFMAKMSVTFPVTAISPLAKELIQDMGTYAQVSTIPDSKQIFAYESLIPDKLL